MDTRIDKLAQALDVEPGELYRWIGGLQPADRERSKVAARLRLLRVFEAYFERRNQRIGAAWQQ